MANTNWKSDTGDGSTPPDEDWIDGIGSIEALIDVFPLLECQVGESVSVAMDPTAPQYVARQSNAL